MMSRIAVSALSEQPVREFVVEESWLCALLKENLTNKIVILDDDPTGIQTVHNLSVFMTWDEDTVREGFSEDSPAFFILTNSRSLSGQATTQLHQEIARTIAKVSQEQGQDFILISRGDSTLRGHYPLEMEVLKDTLEQVGNKRYDAEILLPYFEEGGRYTLNNIHYLQEGDWLVPVGESEFAKDKTFAFSSSHLGAYVEEKTEGRCKQEDCIYISLELLRQSDVSAVQTVLMAVNNYQRIVVNAVCYEDVMSFVAACVKAIAAGKQFLFRTAASFVKTITGTSTQPYLSKTDLIDQKNTMGGVVIIGSHVQKTTLQFETLTQSSYLCQVVTFNQHRVLERGGLQQETQRVITVTEQIIQSGSTAVIVTRRERFDLPDGTPEQQLAVAVEISDALAQVIGGLSVRPNFIVAKGGITSSDVATKALTIKKGRIMGQVAPGIPVVMTGEESKFPQLPYVIFPGNVGNSHTLLEILQKLS